MDNLIESYSSYLIQRINTKKDKELYSEILGVFLYAAYPKPNIEIFFITSKITNSDNQIRVVGHYFIDYLNNQGWDSTEKSIDNILPQSHFDDANMTICYLYLEMSRSGRVSKNNFILLLRNAAIKAILINNHKIRTNIITRAALEIKEVMGLNEVLKMVRSFENFKYDNIDLNTYKIVDKPEMIDNFHPDHVKEVYNRLANDWILWCLLAQHMPNLKSDPVLHFRYILHISRSSDLNKDIKIDFLHDFVEYYKQPKNKLPKKSIDKIKLINKKMEHSTSSEKTIKRLLKPLMV